MNLLLSTVGVLGLASLALNAQNQPDFSGKWNMDLSRSEAAAQGTPIGPVVVVIRQTATELHIETTRNGGTQVVRYLPAAAKAAGATDYLLGAFRWDGPKLITTLVTAINNQAVTVQETRSLNAAGSEMTVDVSLVVEHGYQSGGTSVVRSQNSPNTSRGTNVFVKQQ
jgi:hypothetical protein